MQLMSYVVCFLSRSFGFAIRKYMDWDLQSHIDFIKPEITKTSWSVFILLLPLFHKMPPTPAFQQYLSHLKPFL